jgi:hypothetical protein
MTVEASGVAGARSEIRGDIAVRSDMALLRSLAITAGLCWSLVFVVVGLDYGLQMYADGAIFSYAVAVQDAWAFHWHNIPDRMFVFLFSSLPAEAYVALSHDAPGGVTVYGFLFFVVPLLGLGATYVADRSSGRVIFSMACGSTACLCPLVFGFPTEVWMSHALFWPTLAVCHYARNDGRGIALVFAMLLALVFTHEGALIFAFAILLTLLLRGTRDAALLRAIGVFCLAMAIWTAIKEAFPPDAYIVDVLLRAALAVFDISIFYGGLVLLLLGALALYLAAFFVLRRRDDGRANVYAAAITTAALTVYWVWFDHTLHAENRYYLRTALLVITPAFGLMAAMQALAGEHRLAVPMPLLHRLMAAAASAMVARLAIGALALVTLVHVVETAKFVTAWRHYTAAVQVLAMGRVADPALGDPRFISSQRIGPDLNRLSWFSTTPYLSVLVAPRFAPRRLVIDPTADFFWLSCRTATENFNSDHAVPAESRRLVQKESCLHRRL